MEKKKKKNSTYRKQYSNLHVELLRNTLIVSTSFKLKITTY